MNKNKFSLAKFSTIFSVVAGVLMIILFSHYLLSQNIHMVEQSQMRGDVQILEAQVELVENESAALGVEKIYTMHSGDITDGNDSLAFFTYHQYVDVYIDDLLVYSLKKSDECSLGKTTGANWVNVDLKQTYAHKEIKVILEPVYKSAIDHDTEFVKGPQINIILKQLKSDCPLLALAMMAVFAGIVLLLSAAINFRAKQTGDYIFSLGIFAVMIGVWKFTDIGLSCIMWPNKTILFFYISLGMLMFIPVPIMKAMKSFFDEKLHGVLDCCGVFAVVIALIQIVLQLANVYDLRETLFLTHIVIVLCALTAFVSFIYEKAYIKRSGTPGIGRVLFVLCAAGALADLILYYIRDNSFGLVFTLLSFLIYVVVIGFELAIDYYRKQAELMEKEIELTESRIDLMVSQIQPHFLYNVITSIMAICMMNADKAVTALADFADYLRGNLDSLQSDKMIMFSKELRHIESYLRLEKLRFPEKLKIEYDMEIKDFLIPTLSIQPLVENAVKHGVGQKEDGGTVRLVTRELGDHILILVEDDGVGFDPSVKKDDGRSHLGLENVRKRVSDMSKGEMEVKTVKGEGTTISIKIPKDMSVDV